MIQPRGNYANISMNVFFIMNVITMQRRRYYTNIPMNTSITTNVLISQLGTSCSFDSPGLARNEPTPGKHSQGDSTPSVLSFFYEGIVIARSFMADYA
ncbi:tetrahydrofolate synthase [Segatella salivae]|uniref:tetrahydrofolate synthase n=2 Tax=Segatella salivae TaxID=228604 RepID=UPI0021514CE5|nr:tetrahydrofolate synthase [Segatella salivae]